jgi:regulator of sirC expression with transglutaminase-like and TPR domain
MAYFHLRNKEETIKNWEAYLEKVPTGPQSETIKKAIAWLKLPAFQWPEEIEQQRRGNTQNPQNQARIAELEKQKREQEEKARKFLAELKKQREEERLRRLREERDNVRIRTRQITPNDRGREEGQRYDAIER